MVLSSVVTNAIDIVVNAARAGAIAGGALVVGEASRRIARSRALPKAASRRGGTRTTRRSGSVSRRVPLKMFHPKVMSMLHKPSTRVVLFQHYRYHIENDGTNHTVIHQLEINNFGTEIAPTATSGTQDSTVGEADDIDEDTGTSLDSSLLPIGWHKYATEYGQYRVMGCYFTIEVTPDTTDINDRFYVVWQVDDVDSQKLQVLAWNSTTNSADYLDMSSSGRNVARIDAILSGMPNGTSFMVKPSIALGQKTFKTSGYVDIKSIFNALGHDPNDFDALRASVGNPKPTNTGVALSEVTTNPSDPGLDIHLRFGIVRADVSGSSAGADLANVKVTMHWDIEFSDPRYSAAIVGHNDGE